MKQGETHQTFVCSVSGPEKAVEAALPALKAKMDKFIRSVVRGEVELDAGMEEILDRTKAVVKIERECKVC